jgi:hypothetical protein
MAFCTQLEWESDFPFDRYEEMIRRSGSHDSLPEGCLARIVGRKDSGAYILEVWESPDDAGRFGESNAPLLKEFRMPMPSRSAAFETVIFKTR